MDERPAGFRIWLSIIQTRTIGEDENCPGIIAVDISDNACEQIWSRGQVILIRLEFFSGYSYLVNSAYVL